jgi:hypothetical protein
MDSIPGSSVTSTTSSATSGVTRRDTGDPGGDVRREASRDARRSLRPGAFLYEPLEPFGQGLTTARPWNLVALAGVERLNGRVAMLGFAAALVGEAITGRGVIGQLMLMLRWLLG